MKAAERVVGPLLRRWPDLPDDPAMYIRLNGVAQVAAGALLAMGKLPRLAALALIASLIPSTYAGHPFWAEIDSDARAKQCTQFWKNGAILGALMALAAKPSGR